MKKYLILLACVFTLNANAQTTQDAKDYINTNIITNGTGAITGSKMNTALNKIISATKWDSLNNKLSNSYADTIQFNSSKVVLDGYKNSNINIPTYQVFNASSISYDNKGGTYVGEDGCDGTLLVNLDSINKIDGNSYNITDTISPICDVYEFELEFDISNINICENGYISQVLLHTKNTSVTQDEAMATGLFINNNIAFPVDGTNEPFVSGLETYLSYTNNISLDTVTSIKAMFLWASDNIIEMDGIELILKIGGCDNYYIVLNTDSNGIVKLDTLQGLIDVNNINDYLPTQTEPINIANTNLSVTDSYRTLNGGDGTLSFLNFNRFRVVDYNGGDTYFQYSNGNNQSNTTINHDGIYINSQDDLNNAYTSFNTNSNSVNWQIHDNNNNFNTTFQNTFNRWYFNISDNNLNKSFYFDFTPSNYSYLKKNYNDGLGNYESGLFWEDDTSVTLLSSYGATASNTNIILSPNAIFLKTPKVSNLGGASNGDVLTLLDNANGTAEWSKLINGLTKYNDTIGLGGALEFNTYIDGYAYNKSFDLKASSFLTNGISLRGKSNNINSGGILILGENTNSGSDIILQANTQRVKIVGIPIFNTQADAYSALDSNEIYKLTGDDTIYQRP